jgi:chitin disaccharide deacetylase
MRVCVTADDYGLSPAGNAATEELVARGVLSAVSVMVHEGALLDRVTALARTGVAVGLHLVLTRERPVSDALHGTPLVDGEGRLPPDWRALFVGLARRPWLLARVRTEAQAQLARFSSLGVPLAFVNGHEHVHVWPLLWPIAAALAASVPGAGVRTARDQGYLGPRQALVALCSRASWALRSLADRPRYSPLGIDDAERLTRDALERHLRSATHLPPTVIPELVVHPAYDQALLASPDVRALLARHRIPGASGAPGGGMAAGAAT